MVFRRNGWTYYNVTNVTLGTVAFGHKRQRERQIQVSKVNAAIFNHKETLDHA